MRKFLSALALTIVAIEGGLWEITWTPHPDNKALIIVYNCQGGTPFFAYNRFDILPDRSRTRVRRVYIPEGSAACWAGAEIVRSETGDVGDEYRAEWNITRVPE